MLLLRDYKLKNVIRTTKAYGSLLRKPVRGTSDPRKKSAVSLSVYTASPVSGEIHHETEKERNGD